MDIKSTEQSLGARYAGSYASGHMGAQIIRFERGEPKNGLVVKFAQKGNAIATEEIEANLYGYNQMKMLGGSELVPPDLREVSTEDGRAIVMRDLVTSMRAADGGLTMCTLLWRHFRDALGKTVVMRGDWNSGGLPRFVAEVCTHIERFSHAGVPALLEEMGKADWTGEWGMPALMLLDFTPDNLFVSEAALSFIDPWKQGTYLGHPAVSIGQFSCLMRLYHMKDSKEASRMLEEHCLAEMPSILGCEVSAVSRAFNLGQTLQLVLSSYVRRESERDLAAQLIAQAHGLWT